MKKILVSLFAALMLLLPQALLAGVEHLLPKVHSLNVTNQPSFELQRPVSITDANNTAALKKVFTDYGCTIQDGASATVTVQMVECIEGAYDYTLEGYDNEGYQLIVETNAITIKAVKPIGVIRAAQTLAQLAEGYEEGAAAIEAVEITDWAAFKLRGYMHDVGRSFISVEELKKHIDLLSRFKVNTFHWHFTENQAWRFEVEGYPQLTSKESMTRFAGKYYTQDECSEVAAYAKERGVIIIPEIDMPGHSDAFDRAMGYGMQTDNGVAVLKEVLTQVAAVFPDAPYIHIGADEETITYTKDGKGFLAIMADHIHGLGKKLVVWNPISGVTINNTMCDMTQMWSSRGTNINGVPDIDCRYNYTNHFDVFADVVGIYKSNIYYADKGSEEIAGTISAYWNDRKMETEEDIVKQNNMYANVLASAERAWMGSKVNGEAGYIEKTGTTLPNSGEVYEEFKNWEERFLFHKAHSLKNEPIPYVKQTNVRWRITEPFPNNGNASATSELDKYATSTEEGLIPETYTHEGKTYYTGMATGAGIYLRHVWGNNIIPTYYGSTNYSNHTAYAWTYVYSPEAQTVGAQIEFQNYGRSEHDQAPDNGKWDRKGSDIWLNGQRIAPPTWDNAGFDPNNEDDLKNENFSARKPIEVTLKKGWNKVFIKLPYVGASNVRLNKWMFTFVLTDTEGKNAVEGLIYSPNQCLDEATELVAAKVSELKRDRSNLVGTAVGLWPESAAAALDTKIAAIEATYSATMTAEERAAQVAELETAWEAFVASLANASINLPVSGNCYRMYTPQRDNRYVTGNGVDAAITGNTSAETKMSIWKFVSREDGSYDIINLADGGYITTSGDPLKTVAARPNTGWTIKKAANTGNVIVVSGSAQFNQQNHSSYHLLNWGSGTNTSDDGCQYRFVDVTSIAPAVPIKQLANAEGFENGGVYTFVTSRGWMGATASSNNAISTARTNVTPAADNAYFQWTVYKSQNGNYYLYNIGKEKFLGVQSSNNATVPLVDKPAGKALTFKASSSTEYPIMFSTDNAGVVNHSPNHGEGLITWTGGWNTLNDAGSNHKVALITKLSNEELAKIANIVEAYDVYDESAKTLPQAGKYYRIGYDFGGNAGVKYLQSTNSSVKGLAMTSDKGEGSIFYVEEVGGKLKLKSHSTGKYLKETGNTRGLHDEGGDVTFTKGASDGKVKIQAPAYLHAGNSNGNCYVDHCSGDGCAAHNFFVEEVVLVSLTVNGPSKVGATATWNGATKPLPATWAIFEGVEITKPTLSISSNETYTFSGLYEGETLLGETVNIESVTEDRTLTARFAPAFFSSTYGEKWVRLGNCANNNYYATIEGEIGKTAVLDYADEKQLWCLVGDANSFVLYNKATGESKALNVPVTTGYNDGDAAKLTSDKGSWRLIEQDFGYALAPTAKSASNTKGINMYGGNGGDLKLWGSDKSNTGTYWVVEVADLSNPLTFNVEVDQVWESSPRVAELTFTVNGKASATRILGSVEGQQLYLPAGATYEVSSMTYRGYTYNGYEEADGVLTVSYTANEERTLYYSRRDGHPYRIPAIATAPNGDIFAICDYRPCNMDIGYGEVDLVCRVSSDNGVTWTEEKMIADGKGDAYAVNDTAKIWQVGFGDPAIVADRERNEVLVMSVCGNQTCWDGTFGEANPNPNRVSRLYITYDEEKKEWVYGEPEEVTYDIYPKFIDKNGNVHAASLFIGAGKICQSRVVKKGDYYRLYCAVWNVTKTQRQHHNYVIYSDDFGKSWNVLGELGYDNCPSKWGNEPKCEELPDGTVVLSSRKNYGRYFNLFTFDDDTYTTGSWKGEVSSNDVQGGLSFGGNSTNGEIYKVAAIRKADGAKCDIMFQSIPTGGDRSNVAIYYKEMQYNADGTNKYTATTFSQGWTKGKHVSTKGSCYSTMIMQNDGRIGFFFEEEPSDYCMVYIPYTIEELTGGAYSVDGDFVTSIEEVPAMDGAQHDEAIYDLMGRKLDKVIEHGIYIVGGKKVAM